MHCHPSLSLPRRLFKIWHLCVFDWVYLRPNKVFPKNIFKSAKNSNITNKAVRQVHSNKQWNSFPLRAGGRVWPEKKVNHGSRVEVAAWGQCILMSPPLCREMKWGKWWRKDAARQARPHHLLITSSSLWLEGPAQMRTVVALRPQGIHKSTLRVWMMYDRAELTQFKTDPNCCKSRSCKVKSFKLASLRQRMASVSERSKVNCLSSSLWGGLLCAATELYFMKTVL